MKRLMKAALLGLGLSFVGSVGVLAHTVTLTWTWPTARQDGSALALSSIGGIVIYDTSIPVPNQPGTAITCSPGTLPPTTATGTCTTGTLTAGVHGFVAVVNDNSSPPIAGAASAAVSVTVPLSGPNAVTLSATLN